MKAGAGNHDGPERFKPGCVFVQQRGIEGAPVELFFPAIPFSVDVTQQLHGFCPGGGGAGGVVKCGGLGFRV